MIYIIYAEVYTRTRTLFCHAHDAIKYNHWMDHGIPIESYDHRARALFIVSTIGCVVEVTMLLVRSSKTVNHAMKLIFAWQRVQAV